MDNAAINAILRPKTIAVIGASTVPGKIGYTVVKGLLEAKYTGKIYPVNTQGDELLGLKMYASVMDIPGPVDAAVITVPAKFVSQVIDDCAKKDILLSGRVRPSNKASFLGKFHYQRCHHHQLEE